MPLADLSALFHAQAGTVEHYTLGFKDWSSMPVVWRFLQDVGVATVSALALWYTVRVTVRLVRRALDDTAERRAAEAQRILRYALDQRSKIELAMGTGKSAPCSLLEVTDTLLKLEAPAFTNLTRDAVDKDAECFFKVPSESRGVQWDFYSFRCRVLDLVPGEEGAKILTVPMPPEVRTGQKRRFYRLAPPRHLVLRLAAWPDAYSSSSVRNLPKPSLLIRPQESRQVHISNISAGGLLLDAERQFMAHSGLPLEPGDTWFVFLAVHDPLRDERLNWWLRAVLVNAFDGTRGRMDLAFRFNAFADALQSGVPVWQSIPEDGVGKIATWVFLRSLELTREGKDLD